LLKFSLFALLILCIAILIEPGKVRTECVVARDAYSDVMPGEFFRYVSYQSVLGNDTEYISIAYSNLRETRWNNVTVLENQGENITYRWLQEDDTKVLSNYTLTLDMVTGTRYDQAGNISNYGWLYFIGSDLLPGETAYPLSPLRINDTLTRGYMQLSLQVNHVGYIYPVPINQNVSGIVVNMTAVDDAYWHKPTGILMEVAKHANTSRVVGNGTLVTFFKDAEVIVSTIPPIPEFTLFIGPFLLMTGTLATVSLVKRRAILQRARKKGLCR